MPVLQVEMVDGPAEAPAGLAQALADAAGRVLDAPPGHTWVRLRRLPASGYAENGPAAAGTPAPAAPVFVEVLQRAPPAGAALEAEVKALTAALAAVLARPADQVHVLYAPAAAGRQAFGGVLVR